MAPSRTISVGRARKALVLAASILLVVALAIVIANARRTDDRFCTADGRLGPDGQIYGRDPNKGCRFVDENGRVLPGQP
jgi:hypothetical protein